MATVAETPKSSFRLGMLIYDTRYRSITIQVIVLFLVFLFVSWLVDNTIQNLAAKDKDINFNFLWNRAGYDIDQQLIPYTNDSTHGRAAVIGLLNTLVVAFFGCILATIIGVFAGVLRLSNNWLVARIMTVYVEVFRNIPLLLWIILTFTIFSETQPEPKDFKVTQEMVNQGISPPAHKIFFDTVAITNRGSNIPLPLLERPLGGFEVAGVPVNFSVLATLLVIFGSVMINRTLLRQAKTTQEETGIRPVTWWKSLAILFLPTIALLVAMGLHFEVPAFAVGENGVSKGFNFVGGLNVAHSFTALLIALSLYTGAYIAEAVRGGILAISRGQTEAAYALGLRPGRTMRLVILPQALRVIIPPLISQYLNLTKNTTLGIAISYLDLKGTLGGITLNQTGRELECMLLMMLTYLILSLIISTVMNAFNSSMKLKER
jgi:general L-amino acid transport system permease protein